LGEGQDGARAEAELGERHFEKKLLKSERV
jgi:hypothetical protein